MNQTWIKWTWIGRRHLRLSPQNNFGWRQNATKEEENGWWVENKWRFNLRRASLRFRPSLHPGWSLFSTRVWRRQSRRRLPSVSKRTVHAFAHVCRRWGNQRGQLCATGAAQRKVKPARKGAAIPEESLGAQKIQSHLTLKIRGLTASKGHWEDGLGSSA